MKTVYRVIGFLALNFFILYLGSFLSQNGPNTDWYQTLNKAPWTPKGWVFGAAWTIIMVCFSFYFAYIFNKKERQRKGVILFILQAILNVIWNPLFFYFQHVSLALIDIILLFILISIIFLTFLNELRFKSILLVPYILWLLIAISLNLYIWLFN